MGSLGMGRHVLSALIGATLVMWAQGASAQEQASAPCSNQVTDWSICVAETPKECWAVSTAKESVNTKEGRVVAVRRSDILFMVFFRPEVGVKGQVGFTGGYPFASGSTVNLSVDGNSYDLFTEGEWAWPASSADDSKIVTAMKRGSKATLSAQSARGTKTQDTFSLSGFTAAVEGAEKRCN